jgi:hypothetical protein
MKKRTSILRSMGLMMLCLVWLTSVFGKQLPQVHHEKHAPKPATEQQDKQQQTTISELSLAVVVPSHAFSFAQDFIIVPAPQVIFLITEKIIFKVEKPLFIISYFDNLFEHHIAINAP